MTLSLKNRHLAATALAAAAAAASPVAQAGPMAVTNTTGDVLLGFNGIQVNNTDYDVRFADGSCVSLFNGCSSNANSFLFTTRADAHAASQALGAVLSQGGLSARPNGIAGGVLWGHFLTPFGSSPSVAALSMLEVESASNTQAFLQGASTTSVTTRALAAVQDTAMIPQATYAKWSVAAPAATAAAVPVPEPGSLAMVAVGLGAVALAQGKVRRRRQNG